MMTEGSAGASRASALQRLDDLICDIEVLCRRAEDGEPTKLVDLLNAKRKAVGLRQFLEDVPERRVSWDRLLAVLSFLARVARELLE